MLKKFLKTYLLLFLIIFTSFNVNAQSDIKLYVDGKYIETDVSPEIYNGRTFVPVRVVSEALGYNIQWIGESNQVVVKNDNIKLVLTVNSKNYILNNESKSSDVAPTIVNQRTLVPLRLVAESFNEQVSWDNENRTVIIGDDSSSVYEKATVTRIVDGDTIVVDIDGNSKTVRFVGVNTPETKHPTKGVEYYGKEASQFTTKMLEGKTVYLQKDVSDTDRYNRLLRFIWLNKPATNTPTNEEIEKNMFNAILVANGYANVSTYAPDNTYENIFITLENKAKENKIGMWANTSTTTTSSSTNTTTTTTTTNTSGKIKGNKNSKIYHLPGQQFYNTISESNVVYFDTEEEAIKAGYTKSKR